MFYDTSAFKKPLEGLRDDRFHAVVMLLPSESKRLIAKGTIQVPEIQRVLKDGWFIGSRGVTPAYVLEELTGELGPKQNYTAGIVTQGRLGTIIAEDQVGPWVFKDGKLKTPALVTLFHNGVLAHDKQKLLGVTIHRGLGHYDAKVTFGPIGRQDIGSPVRFRNIWIKEE